MRITTPFDFSILTPEEFQQATLEQGRDVTVQGLVAMETRWLLDITEVTLRPPYRKPLGVSIAGRWYYAWPVRWDKPLDLGEYTVMRLSR
ncbi:hypothetical protein DEDE109153_09580 [Deinococcus deserti]|uniref:hypothetical protein n=1 Tax=Deinococcus deserti TaxID=310783 RepID=UPI00059E4851|nr:hypothetical protein [Deinococcus deserti]